MKNVYQSILSARMTPASFGYAATPTSPFITIVHSRKKKDLAKEVYLW